MSVKATSTSRFITGRLTVLSIAVAALLFSGEAAIAAKFLDITSPPEFEFNGQRFGAAPAFAMNCLRGDCPQHPSTFPIATYTLNGGLREYAGVPVTPPRYTYWQQQLSRVLFRLECDVPQGAQCLDAVVAQLDARYDLTLLKENTLVHHASDSHTWERLYVTGAGAVVTTRLTCWEGAWELPLVEIIDQRAMNEAALAANPDYRVKQLRLPEGFVVSR